MYPQETPFRINQGTAINRVYAKFHELKYENTRPVPDSELC